MDTKIFERVKSGLEKQRQNLMEWLNTVPESKKKINLGSADESELKEHLKVLDTALEKTEDKTLGKCIVCHDYIEPSRLEMDYTANVCIDHFSGEEKRRLEFELELSQKVQKALLPQEIPNVDGLEISAFSQPARIVGGDYFDFFKFKDNSFGIVIADVMGKGMPASLLMASLQASLRIVVQDSYSPQEVAKRLNFLFRHNINLTKFVTLFIIKFDYENNTLIYCNAGHNPPIFLQKQQLQWLRPTGAAIGLVEEADFKEETISFSPGDILLLYTDGVTETMNSNEEEFGEDGLAEFINKTSKLSAKDLIRELRKQLQDFTNNQPVADDTTIVVCKIE